MADTLRLMAVLAHPDDETLGLGGILAYYADDDTVETYLVTATRGEHGWFGPPDDYPGPTALGQLREKELEAAANVLGLREVQFLDYIDGELDQADPTEAITRIVRHLRRVQPHVVVTFDPFGVYGHPDHIAISQLTQAAIVAAANAGYDPEAGQPPHQVDKLYYMVETEATLATYEDAFGDLVMTIDGEERRTVTWDTWAITTEVDSTAYLDQVWQAVVSHRSQLPGYQALKDLPRARREIIWGRQKLYRVFSFVNGGRAKEHDLFAGLRHTEDQPTNPSHS